MNYDMITAIDPGATGAIAHWDRFADGLVSAIKMPDTPKDLYDYLQDLSRGGPVGAKMICEKVGGYMPGNSGPSACKFARHCGHLDMALLAVGVPHEFVTPHTWMKSVMGTVPKEKKDRKNAIKQKMQQLYPHIKVTLVNADALGILTYALSL